MDEVVEKNTERLKGQIERITFFSEEDGYTIVKIKVAGKREPITAVGHFMSPNPGEIIEMTGKWVRHPKYGDQFKITSYKTAIPATVYGIERYLGSGLIKGIGPIMARRIVKKFGKETLNIIEEDIEKLKEVEGIGEKRICMIKKAWEEQREIRDLMIFLQEHGISPSYAPKIYRKYRENSIQVIKENPYRLAMDIYGIGFITADRIAEKLGFPKDSELRATAGIIYVLQQIADEGHVYCPYEELLERCKKILDVSQDIIENALRKLQADERIVKDEEAVYLAQFYVCETGVAKRLIRLMEMPKSIRRINTEKAIEWVQKKLGIRLAEMQKEAIRAVSENKVVIITGGPGTGKTTVINAIIKIFSQIGAKILLAAPTGRASKRMTETSGHEAKTIHRLLEYSPERGEFKKNERSPLKCDILIIDEASMIDIVLMYHLIKAVPLNATVVIVGDVNQLPSVGPGSVLKDMISSGIFPVVKLNEIFRQARESLIVINAHRINAGQFPIFKSERRNADFYFIEEEDPEKGLSIIINLVKDRIPKKFGFDPYEDIQVITPMNKGIIGAENLNEKLQKALNPFSFGITKGTKKFKVKDKVMQLRNNYEKGVFNGDIGRIVKIDQENQEVFIAFDTGIVAYDYSELDEISLAYAISVHKSQGSEYPAVVIPIFIQHYVLLQRNLIYTAITRGKKLVVIVGTKKAFLIGIKNNKIQRRYTKLNKRLSESKL
ncbi:MAG: ATP-dependent RecD-like DNA helicase [Deltaproteobacteria bacterium]|nr:MAG: ATP-dependent RecD-like DNA helicase [Deltaproteobacteria bacterium]